MGICPPFCKTLPVILPEPATMFGSNDLALALLAFALLAIAGFALWRKYRKSEV